MPDMRHKLPKETADRQKKRPIGIFLIGLMAGRDRTLERLQPIPGLHIRPTGIGYSVRVRAMTSKNLHTKTRNRLARQDALREYMQERGSVQYLFDIIEKIEKLDPNSETFQQDLAKYSKVVDVRHKMLGKYLPAGIFR
jgi:hypothetical protein